jgi:hypothetical protein
LNKIFLGPSYVHARIFRAVSGSAQSINIFFLPFSPVLHQNEAISGSQVSKIKFSLKIDSP